MRKDSWNPAQIAFLKENYSKMAKRKIASTLKKSPETITRKARMLGLSDEVTIKTKSMDGMKSIKIDDRTTIYIKADKDPEEAKRKFIEMYKYGIK